MSKGSNNKTLLIAILLISVIIAVGFIPAVSQNIHLTVTESGENLGNTLKYEKSIHILVQK